MRFDLTHVLVSSGVRRSGADLPAEDTSADRANEAKIRVIFMENLEVVKRAWARDPFSRYGACYGSSAMETKYGGNQWAIPSAIYVNITFRRSNDP